MIHVGLAVSLGVVVLSMSASLFLLLRKVDGPVPEEKHFIETAKTHKSYEEKRNLETLAAFRQKEIEISYARERGIVFRRQLAIRNTNERTWHNLSSRDTPIFQPTRRSLH